MSNLLDELTPIDLDSCDELMAMAYIETIEPRWPEIMPTIQLQSQKNPNVVRQLLSVGYVPSEEYVYRSCALEWVVIVQLLCEYGTFDKLLCDREVGYCNDGDDCIKDVNIDDERIAVYAIKRKVADILLHHRVMSKRLYDRLHCLPESCI